MMHIVKVELLLDTRCKEQLEAYMNLLTVIGETSEVDPTPETTSEAEESIGEPARPKRKYTKRQKPESQEPEQTATGEGNAEPEVSASEPEQEGEEAKEYTIEDVRKLLSQKVVSHREEIKEKLTELGAPNVSTLKAESYSEMVAFLSSLS